MKTTLGRLFVTVILALAATTATFGPARAAVWIPVGVASVCPLVPGCNGYDDANKAAAVGSKAIRIPVAWNVVQASSPAAYDWSRVDASVAGAKSAGQMILLVIYGPAPVWAQAPGADHSASGTPPADPATFGTFAAATAQRYAQYVTAFEVWNEPNLPHYLQPPTAAAYLPLLKAAYQGIRSAGAQQPIVSGGTSSSPAGTPDTTFISDLYALGGKAYFDAVGVHPYTFPNPITSTGSGVLTSARQVMEANGDAAKKMWITEYGQPTGASAVSVSEQQQAQILVDAIQRVQQLSWIGVFFVFNTRDLLPDPTVIDANFGLFRYDGTPKQSAFAVRSLLVG